MVKTAPKPELVSERIYHHLREGIVNGRRKPEDKLVRRTLAKEYGVSPLPVMEALFLLERDGLVESGPNETARVRGWSLGMLRNDQVLREAIECEVAWLIAEQVPPSELDEAAEMADRLDKTKLNFRDSEGQTLVPWEGEKITQREMAFRLHTKFHLTLADLTHFSALRQELERIWMRRMTFMRWLPRPKSETPPQWHTRLVEALKSGVPQTAMDAMREHCRYGHNVDINLMMRHETSRRTGVRLPS